MPVNDHEWDQHHREASRRLGWAPLLANGAVILAVIGGAASGDQIYETIASATLPLIIFGIGAAAGLASEEFALRADIEWKRGTAWWEDDDGPTKRLYRLVPEINELEAREPRSQEIKDSLLARLAEAKVLAARAQTEGPPTLQKVRLSRRLNKIATALRVASMLCCGLGVLALLIEANLKPAKLHSAPAAAKSSSALSLSSDKSPPPNVSTPPLPPLSPPRRN